ncbi:LANO_0E03906g1_1 [Lachancea nothofagi CBS 11611]|uniref:Signal recognition particle subunit SRP72 n=1 Tax=Lachancea nothofagi CBS 11611 TaxID=1266666 RepID=A0A1G4JRL1_9SACH|nr:LANO_0E03906g1_1 [Lachancea nothofagi CBS 11611]
MKDLTSQLTDLNVLYDNNRHSEVAKTCKTLIDRGVVDKKPILRQWLVALIKTDQYKKSWELLNQYDADISDEFYLERLYVLYKLGYTKEFDKLYQKLKTIVRDESSQNRGLLHVRAQFCFKNGRYDEAAEIYEVLSQHNEQQLDNETEIACNERAAAAFFCSGNDRKLATKLNEDSYDLLFNESLIALAENQPIIAFEYLEKASALAAQDGPNDDQFAIELQKSYVLQILGEEKRSKKILTMLLEKNKAGSPNYLLAFSNLKSFEDISKYTANIPLLLRELNVSKMSGMVDTLGNEQQQRVLNNILFLNLFSNSSIQAKKSLVSKTLAQYQKNVEDVVLEPYHTQAKKMYHHTMSAISCGTGGSTVGVVLLTVQLQVVEKEWERAINLCETFLNKSSQTFPVESRVVCYLLFRLYQETGRTNSTNILLARLFGIMQDEYVKEDPEFWRFVAFKLLSQESYDKSEAIFGKLRALSPELSLIRPEANEVEEIRPDLESLVESIDIESIKSQGLTPFEGQSRHQNQGGLGRVAKKRRVHKNRRRPKDFDTLKQPNPERWLPLKDRSDFKPNKKIAAKQTQGGSASRKGDQNLDISKKSKTKKNRK